MEIEIWQIWIIAAIIFLILEIFTPSFIMASVAIGCLFAAPGAYFELSYSWQFLLFSVGTLISFFTVRPFMQKYAYKRSSHIKTNVERIIGKTGKVIQTIDLMKNEGRVALDGDEWKAVSVDKSVIEKGSLVEVVRIESIVIIVKPLN